MSPLERASHICVILLCVVSSGLLIERQFAGHDSARSVEEELVGKTVREPGPWTSGTRTLVAAVTTHCPFCEASMLFYRRIFATTQHAGGGRVNLVFASPEPESAMRQFLAKHGLENVPVLQTSLPTVHVSGTPPPYWCDHTGRVTRAFVGALSETREGQLMALINSPR